MFGEFSYLIIHFCLFQFFAYFSVFRFFMKTVANSFHFFVTNCVSGRRFFVGTVNLKFLDNSSMINSGEIKLISAVKKVNFLYKFFLGEFFLENSGFSLSTWDKTWQFHNESFRHVCSWSLQKVSFTITSDVINAYIVDLTRINSHRWFHLVTGFFNMIFSLIYLLGAVMVFTLWFFIL